MRLSGLSESSIKKKPGKLKKEKQMNKKNQFFL
jgi:hypothetical protein